MTETGEGESPATMVVELPPAEVAAEEQPEKPVIEKKAKVTKEKKPKSAKVSAHPPYFQMIKEALLFLKEKSGSSPYAIAKYMEEKHKAVLPANYKKMLALQLKNCTAKGKLIKIKASYKLSDSKPAVATAAPKAKTGKKKPETQKKSAKQTKKVGAKKVKKSATAKAKQPKSIKSSAAKKTRKTTSV